MLKTDQTPLKKGNIYIIQYTHNIIKQEKTSL